MHKSNRGSLFSAFIIAFLDNFGYSFVFILFAPLILNPEYGFFSNETTEGTKNIFLGVLIGAFPVLMLFGAPFWGDYADRFGRKKAFIFTLLGTAGGHFLSALAILSKSYVFLLLARTLAGFFSGNISICLATVSDLSPTSPIKARNFGITGVLMGIGWILAMVVGGYLSDPRLTRFASPSLPFAIAVILTLFGYLIVKIWFAETYIQKKSVHFDLLKSLHDIKAALSFPQIRPFLIVFFLWSLGWFFTFQWFMAISLEAYSATQETASLYLILLGISWTIGGAILNPILVKRFTSWSLSLLSTFLTAVCILLTTWTHSYFLFSLFFCPSAIFASISMSNNLNLVSMSAPKQLQGTAMGFSQSYQALAGALVPIIGGFLAKWDIGLIFPISAGILFLSVLILMKNRPHK